MSNISRRNVVKGTAWVAPVIAVAVGAPAFAASPLQCAYCGDVELSMVWQLSASSFGSAFDEFTLGWTIGAGCPVTPRMTWRMTATQVAGRQNEPPAPCPEFVTGNGNFSDHGDFGAPSCKVSTNVQNEGTTNQGLAEFSQMVTLRPSSPSGSVDFHLAWANRAWDSRQWALWQFTMTLVEAVMPNGHTCEGSRYSDTVMGNHMAPGPAWRTTQSDQVWGWYDTADPTNFVRDLIKHRPFGSLPTP